MCLISQSAVSTCSPHTAIHIWVEVLYRIVSKLSAGKPFTHSNPPRVQQWEECGVQSLVQRHFDMVTNPNNQTSNSYYQNLQT